MKKLKVIGMFERNFVALFDSEIFIIASTGAFATMLDGRVIYNREFFSPANTLARYQLSAGQDFTQYDMKGLFEMQIVINPKWRKVLIGDSCSDANDSASAKGVGRHLRFSRVLLCVSIVFGAFMWWVLS